jgi:type IV fimbrial biogenesis protein FimT
MTRSMTVSTSIRRGFSLVELLIVVAILVITTTMAGPPMVQWIQSNRVTSAANNILADVKYARSEAIRNNREVHLSAGGTNYANGWSIFTVTATGTRETTLKVNAGLPNQNVTMSTNIDSRAIIFRSDGSMTNTAGEATVTITVGDSDAARGCTGVAGRNGCSVRLVVVSPTGRASTSNPNTFL